MENSNSMQANQEQFTPEQLENMYPEIYHDIFPLVVQSANDIMRNGYTPTDDMMNYYVDNIIRMSGMWDEDEDTAPITAQSVFDPQPFRGRGRRRRHHNRHTLRDITRILLLRELLDRNRRRY